MVYQDINAGELGAAAVVFPVVCIVLTGLRFYQRRAQGVRYGADDWLILPALSLIIAMGAITLWGISTRSEGYFTPQTPKGVVSPQQQWSERNFWLTELLQTPALGATKLSFVFLYRRIFNGGQNRAFNWTTISMIVLLALWTTSFFLATALICPGHASAYWASKQIRAKQCYSTKNMLWTLAFTDVVTDVMIYLIPIPMIWRLHLSTSRKIAVVGIFSLGALAVASSITRAVLWVEFLSAEAVYYDIDMLDTNGVYWMLIETGFALVAANLPVLYGLVKSKGLQSIVRSVRSLGSLRSSQSSGSRTGRDPNRQSEAPNAGAVATEIEMQPRKTSKSDASDSMRSEGIHVTRTMDVESHANSRRMS